MSATAGPHVLIVEDNPVDFRILQYAFSNTGIMHEIQGVGDGESAIALLQQGLESPELTIPRLILLDLNLPRMSGMDVLRAIKANNQLRRIPVIVISSSQFQSDISGAYDSGASLYVRKPNDLDALEDLVGAIAKAWLKYGLGADRAALAARSFEGFRQAG
jgi:chemotaxis family two-component system response regulator Rcp1